LLALGAVLIALTAGYVLMARQFNVTELPSGILAQSTKSRCGGGLSRADQHRRPRRRDAGARLCVAKPI
jgi:hypothetical protein